METRDLGHSNCYCWIDAGSHASLSVSLVSPSPLFSALFSLISFLFFFLFLPFLSSSVLGCSSDFQGLQRNFQQNGECKSKEHLQRKQAERPIYVNLKCKLRYEYLKLRVLLGR